MKSKKTKGIIFILLAVLCYSIMPVLIRILDAGDIPPKTQVFSRYIFAFASALTFFLITKQKFQTKNINWPIILFMGIIGYGLTNVFFTYSMLLTTISNALFLYNIFGIINPILAAIILKEKLNKYNIISLVLALISLFFLFRPSGIDTWKIGGLFALLTAIFQSFYLISRKAQSQIKSPQILLTSTFLGMITVGILSLTTEFEFYKTGLFSLSSLNLLIIALFGIDNFLGWFFMSKGFEYLDSTTGSMLLLLENVLSVIFALVIFTEIPTLFTIIGGLIMISASVISILKSSD